MNIHPVLLPQRRDQSALSLEEFFRREERDDEYSVLEEGLDL
jgi:hypothetical protein